MDETVAVSLTERQQFWLEQVRACEAAGKTIAEYAAEHGLVAQAMYAGKKQLVRKGVLPHTQRSRFQRAQVAAAAPDCQWRIQLPNGVSVAWWGEVDTATLVTVLNTASALE
jgi:hypothetical protein